MFINREKELASLRKLKNSGKFEMAVVYGRRRVGKTTLLREFSKEMESIFFVCDEVKEKMMLRNFSEVVLEHFGQKDTLSPFESWEKAIRFVATKAKEKRLLLVIDEYPYLVNASRYFPSILQRLIDHELLETKLYLVLCGSSVSFMESEVLGSRSPLFGRRTAQLRVEPFTYREASLFFPELSNEEKIIAYGILGGIPQYLQKWNQHLPYRENIANNFLDTSAYLYAEPRFLLRQELREPSLYNTIIESIAQGASRLNEISTRVGEANDKTAKYIATLLNLNILGREVPVTEKNTSRKAIYYIRDNLFKFWYTFVFPNLSLIETGMTEELLNKKIANGLSKYLGLAFENICREYLLYKSVRGELPFRITKLGKWWGNNPATKKEEEIDLLGLGDNQIIIGECKWTNARVGVGELERLREKGSIIACQDRIFVIFSKRGFTADLEELAARDASVYLVTLDDLFA